MLVRHADEQVLSSKETRGGSVLLVTVDTFSTNFETPEGEALCNNLSIIPMGSYGIQWQKGLLNENHLPFSRLVTELSTEMANLSFLCS